MKWIDKLFLFSILLLFLFLTTQNLNKPFYGAHEFNSIIFQEAAKSYVDYGFLKTKLAPMPKSPFEDISQSYYYLNHPVGLPLLLSLFQKILGFNHWVGRLLPIIFSLGSLIVYFYLVKQIAQRFISFVSLLIFATLPIFVYYSQVIVHEPLVLFFYLLTLLLYFSHRISFLGSLFLTTQFDWPGYYLGIALITLQLIRFKTITKKATFIAGTIVGSAIITLAHFMFVKGSLSFLLSQFLVRANIAALNVSLLVWMNKILKHANSGFSQIGILIFIIALIFTIIKWKSAARKEKDFIILLLFPPLIHVALFSQGAFIHDYWLFYFSPGVAYLLAKILYLLWQKRGIFLIILAIILALHSYLSFIKIRDYFTFTEITFYISWQQAETINSYMDGQKIKKISLLTLKPSLNPALKFYLKYPFTFAKIPQDLNNIKINNNSIKAMLLIETFPRKIVNSVCQKYKCQILLDRELNFVTVLKNK